PNGVEGNGRRLTAPADVTAHHGHRIARASFKSLVLEFISPPAPARWRRKSLPASTTRSIALQVCATSAVPAIEILRHSQSNPVRGPNGALEAHRGGPARAAVRKTERGSSDTCSGPCRLRASEPGGRRQRS